jgi:hypothetical protein
VGGAVSQQPEINNALKEDRAKVVYAQDFITYLISSKACREGTFAIYESIRSISTGLG